MIDNKMAIFKEEKENINKIQELEKENEELEAVNKKAFNENILLKKSIEEINEKIEIQKEFTGYLVKSLNLLWSSE